MGHAVGLGPFGFNGSRHTALSHLVVNPADHAERWVLRSFNDAGHAGTLVSDHPAPVDGAGPVTAGDEPGRL